MISYIELNIIVLTFNGQNQNLMPTDL